MKSYTNSEYADIWEQDSSSYYENGLYEQLFNLLPEGKVLEIGCGCGFSTLELLKNHEVLALECNPFLISKAENYLGEKKSCIHKCDVLKLSTKDKNIITDFKPDIIVGCFIGANGLEVLKHIKGNMDISEKIVKYRENIEDIIVSNENHFTTVKVIQLVNRGVKNSSELNEEIIKKQIKDEYDTYVFSKHAYNVTDVSFFDWILEENRMNYSTLGDVSNVSPKQSRATSIIAHRI